MADPKSNEQLQSDVNELTNKIAELESRVSELTDQNQELSATNGALVTQCKALKAGLGIAGATSGLPKKVLDDIERRMDLGHSRENATESALRQYHQDEQRENAKKAQAPKNTNQPAPADAGKRR